MSERERLIEKLKQAFSVADDNYGMPNVEQVADSLLASDVIAPPVKIGQTVYYIFDGFIEPCIVKVIFLAEFKDEDGNDSYSAEIFFDREDCPYVSAEIYFTEIGKTVFLTKEDAEKALKGGAE